MKRAPEIVQEGEWRLKEGAFGKDLYHLTHSTLPPQLAALTGMETVDDFCAARNAEGRGVQKFIPYEELDGVLQDGDMLVMTEPHDVGAMMMSPEKEKKANCLKQRGWHAEIVYMGADGHYLQKAPWHNRLIKHDCRNMRMHPRYSDFIAGIYRVELEKDRAYEAALKAEVRRWVEIFGEHKFPDKASQFNIHEYLDPADFETPDDLRRIAAHLIRKEYDQIQMVTCVQWAYQVLCLALNVPLTSKLLKVLGVYEAYQENWAAALGYADDSLEPLNRVPYVPYAPAETLQSFFNTYAEGVSLIEWMGKGMALGALFGFDMNVMAGKESEGKDGALRDYFSEVLAKRDLTIPLRVPGRPPYRHVMPIQPFCEVRKPSRPGNMRWSYVATAVNGDHLVRA